MAFISKSGAGSELNTDLSPLDHGQSVTATCLLVDSRRRTQTQQALGRLTTMLTRRAGSHETSVGGSCLVDDMCVRGISYCWWVVFGAEPMMSTMGHGAWGMFHGAWGAWGLVVQPAAEVHVRPAGMGHGAWGMRHGA